jgi:hypothetical protein
MTTVPYLGDFSSLFSLPPPHIGTNYSRPVEEWLNGPSFWTFSGEALDFWGAGILAATDFRGMLREPVQPLLAGQGTVNITSRGKRFRTASAQQAKMVDRRKAV